MNETKTNIKINGNKIINKYKNEYRFSRNVDEIYSGKSNRKER